ncbi:tetraacyldisaccharide 4'-kinase [Candidatus Pelagibacter communis]|uniref:tetraacyldisaccharide 4'-kinase n=1 Tax=Pelagibacter ubique TaxID=198252 RepID=UPI00065B3899|nr:tetraacyldisaccharide 4'-kinase [Candidatus Pelagibacter ubique]
MTIRKPNFWNLKEPNILAYLLLPIAKIIQLFNFLKKYSRPKKFKIKTICVGNIYVGGTGKTSLSIELNKIFNNKNIKSCYVKKFYKNQIDEQTILKNNGKLFLSNERTTAIKLAEEEGYEVAILDDGLQDRSIEYFSEIVCFNSINWIGNGLTIPAGPLRENISNLKRYKNIFINGNLENIDEIKAEIKKINPQTNIHLGKYNPLNLNEFNLSDKYIVFSGIGNHSTFISMLNLNGLKIIKDFEYPDHYQYEKKDIDKILFQAENLNCKVITTEKDYVKLDKIYLNKIRFLKSELKIIDEDKFMRSIGY